MDKDTDFVNWFRIDDNIICLVEANKEKSSHQEAMELINKAKEEHEKSVLDKKRIQISKVHIKPKNEQEFYKSVGDLASKLTKALQVYNNE